MKGEALFAAMGGIDEGFVLAAAEILEAPARYRTKPLRLGHAAAVLIALVTFVICVGGLLIGRCCGTKLAGKASILGGVILILIGLEIFLTGVVL